MIPLGGEFSASHFRKNYAFLTRMHADELAVLKSDLKRAKKLLATSPQHLREEREEEVQRMERAVRRAESAVNKDRRDQVESEAIERAMKEEREKRKAGKGEWFMKKCTCAYCY